VLLQPLWTGCENTNTNGQVRFWYWSPRTRRTDAAREHIRDDGFFSPKGRIQGRRGRTARGNLARGRKHLRTAEGAAALQPVLGGPLRPEKALPPLWPG